MELDGYLAQIPQSVISELQKALCNHLNKCGLYYRLFGRVKSYPSIKNKFEIKHYDRNKKMQDILGIRIALYFKDDISICNNIIQKSFTIDNVSEDQLDDDQFCPTRLNFVCKIPERIQAYLPRELFELYPIDATFEIQMRTVYSEGWHEVEHDLRYKCKSEWENNNDLSRTLNGILATLETCDWTMLHIFEELAYRKYKEKDWISMLNNKLRIHFCGSELDAKILNILNSNSNIAKEIFRVDRQHLLVFLSNKQIMDFPKTYDNIVYAINELYIKDEQLHCLCPKILQEQIQEFEASGDN